MRASERAVFGAHPGVALVEASQEVERAAVRAAAAGFGEIGDGLGQIVHERALVRRGKEARAPAHRSLGLGRGDHDEAGEVPVLAPEAVEQPGAEAGPRKGLFAGVHLAVRARVADIVGDARADHAEVVGAAGQVRQELAQLEAALPMLPEFPRRAEELAGDDAREPQRSVRERLPGVGRDAGLGVEEIDVGGAAGHEEEDHALGAGAVMRRPRRDAAPRLFLRLRQEARQPDHAEAGARATKHFSSRHHG
jgi:hypothetical protein